MGDRQAEVGNIEAIRKWIVQNKLKAVGCLWLSGITGSFAYNWSRPAMKTSVKIIHARLHAQALTLAALVGAAAVEYCDREYGTKHEKYPNTLLQMNGHHAQPHKDSDN